ncbi:hypothetical protein [Streptomyces sp. WMMC1477]|uniref:hypothetical protein n=1 Tax=unclassified Streptomyces TaxID=2593676 RepID=UPI003FCEDD81
MSAVRPAWFRIGRRTPRGAAGPGLRAVLAIGLAAGLATGLTGCSEEKKDPDAGTNGVGKLTAERIEKKARDAADAADAVRLTGTLVTRGRTYRLDMRLKDDGGIGEVSAQGGNRFELLRVGEQLFLKADAEFWVHQEHGGEEPTEADREAAGKLDGKYVKVPAEDPAYDQLSGFTTMDVLLDGVLAMDGKRATGERGEVDGVRTIRVTAAGGAGGVMDVSLIDTPYPLRLERAGDAGVITMSDWDKQFSLRAPKEEQVLDYGKDIFAEQETGSDSGSEG